MIFITSFSHIVYGQTQKSYSANTTGMLGLNTIPSARIDEDGTMRAGVSHLDPYIHGYLGFQITPSFYLNFRQTGEVSSIKDPATRVYPGMDVKLRLKEENKTWPEISLGMNSAFGHKKMASEYLAFSKRYKDFDFTGGVAWGRLGSAAHLTNPLRAVSSHFDKDRDFLSEDPNDIDNWFTGEEIDFFGGIEYFTPINGLSLKAEYGADEYAPETASFDYNAPAPWSLGLNYQPWSWVDISAAIIGGEKVMARFSFQEQLPDWWGSSSGKDQPQNLDKEAATFFDTERFKADSKTLKFYLKPQFENEEDDFSSSARLDLTPYRGAAKQIGRAARLMEKTVPNDTGEVTLALHHKGLRGPDIKIIRRDLQRAIWDNQGSPEEIWHDTEIKTDDLIDIKTSPAIKPLDFRFILNTELSLSEDDVGPIYRTAAIVETQQEWPFGILSGFAGRLNIKDNLEDMEFIRGLGNLINNSNNLRARSNAESFSAQSFALEHSYLSWLHSVNTSTHFALTAGLLEKMYGGVGGEIIYRPFGKRYALGADIWRVASRNPFSTLGMDLYDDNRTTGHLNFWYELPDQKSTLFANIGQYLGTDFGATLGMETQFDNGAKLKAFVTGSDQKEISIFGGESQFHAGLNLTFPLGNIPYIPDGSEIRTSIQPIARDTGQKLNKPVDLYNITEPMSYRAISQSWPDLLK
jgi:hypothetical protein